MSDCDILYSTFFDIDTVIERFSLLTDSYRLFVGAAEELTRTPSATQEIIKDATVRTAFLGNILDQLLLIIQIAIILDILSIDTDSPNPFFS